MRNFLRIILYKPILKIAAKFSSKPKRERIFEALGKLYTEIHTNPGKKGLVIPFVESAGKFIIFSDQHKGRRNGADDFTPCEANYLQALEYYNGHDFCFINLGDSEELWENNIWQVKKKNKEVFDTEKKFIRRNKYIKIFGNHDLFWDNDPLAWWHLKDIYGEKIKVYEGVILELLARGQEPGMNTADAELPISGSPLTIFLTHGHQGDAQSDGNWFSKFFVANIWAPLQAFLRINPNTPAYDADKKTLHNNIMYEWSSEQKNVVLITGHTHQPVFGSLTYLERLYKNFQQALHINDKNREEEIRREIRRRENDFTAVSVDYMKMKPSYFNSGCCCFDDGDITGIEIADGFIRLVKWSGKNALTERVLLEEVSLEQLMGQL
ncbi:MAG: metallophosphoesterase family protein [Chitinophagaceae bacterium]|nr:metallophosphoesterase family protein [Chitinophagaceae bacterium]